VNLCSACIYELVVWPKPMAVKFKLVYLTICDCEVSDEMNLWIYEV
jgi:hypothetical protein